MKSISRRDFLKLGALALGGLAFTRFQPETTRFEDGDLVRVATASVSVYKEPSDLSLITGTRLRDEVIHVYEAVQVETPAWNPVWYRVWGGYMNRARLQQVRILYNEPLREIPNNQMLAEVTIPYTSPYIFNQWENWKRLDFRLYSGTVHWITGIEAGPDGKAWYRILDEADESNYFVPAIHMHPITAEEIASISPEVPYENKRIEVSLDTQILTAYEYGKVVLQTNISSGLFGLAMPGGLSSVTPTGRFTIQTKMPSKHMGLADLAAGIDTYSLPGVPWCCFIVRDDGDYSGVAFHGTYWHDNFGVPMSHGCINMRTNEAKWLFQWTRPVADYDTLNPRTLDAKGYGTLVYIY